MVCLFMYISRSYMTMAQNTVPLHTKGVIGVLGVLENFHQV